MSNNVSNKLSNKLTKQSSSKQLIALSLFGALSLSCLTNPVSAQLETTVGSSKNLAAQALFQSSKGKGTAGDYVGQASDLTKALALDPNYGKCYANRGCARFNMHDYRGCIEDIDKALKWYPTLQSIIDVRARAQNALDHPDSVAGGGGGGGGGGLSMAQRQQMAREIIEQAKNAPYDYAEPAGQIMHMAGIVAAGKRADAILHPENLQPVSNSNGPAVSGKDNPFGGAATSSGGFTANKTGAMPKAKGGSGDSPFGGQAGNQLAGASSASSGGASGGDSPFGGQAGNQLGGASNQTVASVNTGGSVGSTQIGGNPFGGSSIGGSSPASSGSASGSGTSAAEYFRQGCQKNQAQDFIGALDLFNHSLELDKSNGDCWVNRGLAKLHLQDVKGALSDFEEGKKLIPNNTQIDQFIQICKKFGG